MSGTWWSVVYLTTLVIIEFGNDVLIKKWTEGLVGNWAMWVATIVHMAVFIFWIMSMRVEMFSRVVLFYSLISVIGGPVLGWLIFYEKLSALNVVGIVLAIVSIVLVGL